MFVGDAADFVLEPDLVFVLLLVRVLIVDEGKLVIPL